MNYKGDIQDFPEEVGGFDWRYNIEELGCFCLEVIGNIYENPELLSERS